MSRAQLTALLAALTLGTVAPRLAAQDTSSAGQAGRDTSGYSGAAGVDTSITADSARDSTSGGISPSLRDAPGRVDAADSAGTLGAPDTSAMPGGHPDTTNPGYTSTPTPAPAAGDSASGVRSAGQSTYGTSQPRDSV
jgi:hypothetical protein